MGDTIVQKILARASGKDHADVGEIVQAKVDCAMSHDNAALVSKTFKTIGVNTVWDPSKIVILLDHRVPANNIKTAEGHKAIREFVREHHIPNFYDIKRGVCHQIMPEFGHVHPGDLIVGTDSHTTTYGAFGAVSTGIGATEMAGVWATGQLWLKVPETYKITVDGEFRKGVYAKDLILYIIGDLRADGADYKSVEFTGEAVKTMSMGSRMTLCNMSMEMGAKCGIVEADKVTKAYLKKRMEEAPRPVKADKDAVYEKEFTYDASELEPMVACPHTVDNVQPVGDIPGIKIDQAVLGSCTNGRFEDLEIAAEIIGSAEIHKDVRLIIAPASQEVLLEAMKKKVMQKLIEAGGILINPGCGPCLGAHEGILAAGERCIASTNRNFQGRMGSTESEIYLASPATVAASAVAGEIVDPRSVIH